MTSEIIPPARPYFAPSDIEEVKGYVDKILSSGQLTLGKYTETFEHQFAEMVGVRHAISVNSGTSALEIALRAYDLKQGDEVVIPTNTFAATAAAVVFSGGNPVITDVARSSLTLDSNTLRKAITQKTRGVIAVHIGGLICPEINLIHEICDDNDLFLIEDAAHAHGSKIDGRQAGSLASAGCFSFYPTKVITSGEGGAITTNSEEAAKTARILRDQGKESFSSNRIVKIGYNWRMPEISAAIGIVQLRRLNEFIQRRNEIAKIYDSAMDGLGLERIITPPNQVNNYYKYTFFLPQKANRDQFKMLCKERGILYSGEVYWPPLHLQPAFHQYVGEKTGYSVTEEWCSRMVNPPMFSQMTKEQAERVINVTRDSLSKLGG